MIEFPWEFDLVKECPAQCRVCVCVKFVSTLSMFCFVLTMQVCPSFISHQVRQLRNTALILFEALIICNKPLFQECPIEYCTLIFTSIVHEQMILLCLFIGKPVVYWDWLELNQSTHIATSRENRYMYMHGVCQRLRLSVDIFTCIM